MIGKDTEQDTTWVTRLRLLDTFPCFANLTATQRQELARLIQEVAYCSGEQIVIEDALVDSIYFIVRGEAEVTHSVSRQKKITSVFIAVLGVGDAIGLTETGFYSSTGKRTATVTAITDALLLRLEIKDFYLFSQKYHLENTMAAAARTMMRMVFIKQSLPFSKIPHEQLQWLANQVQERTVPAGTVLFKQGDEGKECYLIRSGLIEIVAIDKESGERRLALLKPPALLGEATLMTHTARNATARVLETSELFVLHHEQLKELIHLEDNVAKMFMTLMIDRCRPQQNPRVTLHQRSAVDGQEVIVLKNPDNSAYFKLSKEGAYIWQQLDGSHTMQEITLNLAETCNVFAPDMVAALISQLTKADFVTNVGFSTMGKTRVQPLWIRVMFKLRHIMEVRVAFGDADHWITKMYNNVVHYLFTKLGQIALALLAVMGLFAFIFDTANVLLFFNYKHASLLLLLGLIPLSVIAVVLHELGHAFAVKAYGREVHYMGIGWYWFSPIAFTDTSDMWLSARRPRMWVNVAGVYVDTLVAALAAIGAVISTNPYVESMLWLLALYTYIGAVRMLSPLQDMDGYYILMDWVEKPRLRQAAVVWLVKQFPQCIRHPRLFWQSLPEVYYWLAGIMYLIAVSALTFIVLKFIYYVLNISSGHYLSLCIPFLAVLISSLGIIADIRSQAEE